MQAIRHVVLTAFVAVATAACGFLGPGMGPGMAPGDGMEAVGPRFELGPVRTFGADQQDGAGQRMVFFQTRDGWCIETDSMGSEQAPVNVFAACWATGISPEQLTAEAFDADGELIGTQDFG
jgi:hypothetical protein